jgi:hypothetical protein
VSEGSIPPRVRADVGELLDRLEQRGYRVTRAEYFPESFGDWEVDIVGPTEFSLVKDRSQFMVGADRASLERAGLWRGFDDRDEFARLVLAWAAG